MVGGTVSRVVGRTARGSRPGDSCSARAGWQDYAVSDGAGLLRLGPNARIRRMRLGVLGMPGFTAYTGC